MIIAVDFDQTLADTDATKIYSPNTKLINYLIDRRNNEDKVILWTCREDSRLDQAVNWCKEHGLEFNAVNQNLPGYIKLGMNPRKLIANMYIGDDCANRDEFDLPYMGERIQKQ